MIATGNIAADMNVHHANLPIPLHCELLARHPSGSRSQCIAWRTEATLESPCGHGRCSVASDGRNLLWVFMSPCKNFGMIYELTPGLTQQGWSWGQANPARRCVGLRPGASCSDGSTSLAALAATCQEADGTYHGPARSRGTPKQLGPTDSAGNRRSALLWVKITRAGPQPHKGGVTTG